MKFKDLYSFLLILLFIGCTGSQLNNSLLDRLLLNWANVGYKNIALSKISSPIDSLLVPEPSESMIVNHRNITRKIQEASNRKGFNTVILKPGIYKISKPLVFSVGMDSIVLKGSKNSEIKFIGKYYTLH